MSAWTQLRNDLIPLMWIKHGGNRKDWARRLGMALAIGTGAGAAGFGPMAGLLGGGSAAAGGTAATTGSGLLGGGSTMPMAAMGGVPEAAAAPSYLSTAMSYGDKALKGVGSVAPALSAANMAAGGGSPPPPMPPMPAQPGPPPPQGAGMYGSGGNMPPELAGLPPNDPKVIAWKKSRGML